MQKVTQSAEKSNRPAPLCPARRHRGRQEQLKRRPKRAASNTLLPTARIGSMQQIGGMDRERPKNNAL